MQTAPVVALTGPRHAGKAALARREFPALPYVTLADPADRLAARHNPVAFLGKLRGRAIVDEAHRAPELLAACKEYATQLLFVAPIRLGLANTPELHLWPPSLAERERRPPTALLTLARYAPPHAAPPQTTLEALLQSRALDHATLEGDVRAFLHLHDPDRFLRFTELAIQASGEIVDQSQWARSCEVTHTTIGRWLDALERTFHILQPRAVPDSHERRLIRRRKLFFLDAASVATERRFESWGVAEIVKSQAHQGEPLDVTHWATASGPATTLIAGAVSVTFTRLPAAPPALLTAARKWNALAPHHAACVVTTGGSSALQQGVALHPWWRL